MMDISFLAALVERGSRRIVLVVAAFVSLCAPVHLVAQPVPPPIAREFRAAWVSPTEAGDWPSRPGLSVADQKVELREILDRAQEDGLNAVLLHVRTAADALYPSKRVPWSRYLLGRDGSARDLEGYDPLELAIDESHARGLQLHVWFNPFRAMPPDDIGRPIAGHVTRTHPEWIVRYGKSAWIDPGIPAARRAVLDAMLEVVDRYDVDGVHIDDYFYPYLEEGTVTHVVRHGKKRRRITRHVTLRFKDDRSWKRYGRKAGWSDRAAWRRANIDDFVKTLYQEVKARKKWVLVGVSPFGIWRPGHPEGITGLDSYTEIFADSRRWLREGWLDYIAPQLYWPLENDEQRFTRLDAWWRSENVLGRHIWPGLFTMRVGSRNDAWPANEIGREISALREAREGTTESLGHVHFRLRTLAQRLDGDSAVFGDELRATVYAEPALPPASPWLGDATPAAPDLAPGPSGVLQAGAPGEGSPNDSRVGAAFVATPADTVPVRWWLLQTLGDDGQWRDRLLPSSGGALALGFADVAGARWVAVTAISRTGIAGQPAIISGRTAP